MEIVSINCLPVYFGTVSLVSHAGILKGYLLGVSTEIESSRTLKYVYRKTVCLFVSPVAAPTESITFPY